MKKTKKAAYNLSVKETFETFHVTENGLDRARVGRLRKEFGENVVHARDNFVFWRQTVQQLKDWMIIMLLISAGFVLYLGDGWTAGILLALAIINATIGYLKDYRVEKTIRSINEMIHPDADVVREGALIRVDVSRLVPGDYVYLTEGNMVPADVRIVEDTGLITNDATLTGEGHATRKFTHAIRGKVALHRRNNIAFFGTTVASGEGYGIVVATGGATQLGRAAQLGREAPLVQSPVQKEMRSLSTRLTYAMIALSLLLLCVAVAGDMPFKEVVLFAVGFACSLFPQSLPTQIGALLAQTTRDLSRSRVLVKKARAVELLGAVSVICTDKTGTLTKNEMTAVRFFDGIKEYKVSGSGYKPEGGLHRGLFPVPASERERVKLVAVAAALASNAKILPPDTTNETWHCVGDPTEGALVTLALKLGADLVAENRAQPELRELVFDSDRKRMSSLRVQGKKVSVYCKGAPEEIVERATHIMVGGVRKKLTRELRASYLSKHRAYTELSYRTLAIAQRTLSVRDAREFSIDTVESSLTLVGLLALEDPIKETVATAFATARRAGIRVNMLTGDYSATAAAVAKKTGMIQNDDELLIVTADELERMTDTQVEVCARRGGVIFSRLSPDDKLRIVRLLHQAGEVVAVTGDGINDIPALKYANVGVAMGKNGSDIAMNAADIVLKDDNFGTLIRAIIRGRVSYANIKKAVASSYTTNIAEAIVNGISLLLAAFAGIPLALSMIQLLAIDLLAEFFPIAALGWDKSDRTTSHDPPRDSKEKIITTRRFIDILFTGAVIAALAIGNYLLFFSRQELNPAVATAASIVQATSITYATIMICQLINITHRRFERGLFARRQLTNIRYWVACVISIGIIVAIMYVPGMNTFFNSGPISGIDWAYVAIAGVIFAGIKEMQRVILNRRR